MNLQDRVERYFGHVRDRDLEGLSTLFAEEAVVILPDGRELVGLAAIRGMYQQLFGSGAPSPTPLGTILGEGAAATEIEARLPDGSIRRTANFFRFDAEGRVIGMNVYRRG